MRGAKEDGSCYAFDGKHSASNTELYTNSITEEEAAKLTTGGEIKVISAAVCNICGDTFDPRTQKLVPISGLTTIKLGFLTNKFKDTFRKS